MDGFDGRGSLVGVDTRDSSRLRDLFQASLALSSELSLDALLQKLVETAATLTDAPLCGARCDRRVGRGLERFVTTGLDEETHDAIGDLPRGRGILGVLIRDARAAPPRPPRRRSALRRLPARPPADGLVPRRARAAAGARLRQPLPDGEGGRRVVHRRTTRSSSRCSPRRPRSRSRTRGSTSPRRAGRGSSSPCTRSCARSSRRPT